MATISSTASGNWSAGGTWVGGIAPVIGDKVNIQSGHVVTVDGTGCGGGDDTSTAVNIKSGGTLAWSAAASSTLTVRGELVLESGGNFQMGTAATPIPSTYTATLILNDSASLVDQKWGFTSNMNGAGSLSIYGAAKTTWTQISADIAIGATSCVVLDATGWATGDTLVFSTTSSTRTQYDTVTISTITPGTGTTATITWVGGTTYAHSANCPVGNYTNNCIITPMNTTYRSYFAVTWNTSQSVNTVTIRYVTFLNLSGNTTGGTYDKQAALTLRAAGSNTGNDVINSVGNISFYQTLTGASQANLQFGASRSGFEVSDCTFFHAGGNNISCYNGATLIVLNRMNIQLAGSVYYSFSHGYSEGLRGLELNDSYVCGAGLNLIYLGGSLNAEHNNCYFWGSPTAITLAVTSAAKFNNCYFGTGTPGNGSFTASYIINFGVAATGDVTLTDCYFDGTKTVVDGTSILTAQRNAKIYVANKDVDPSVQEIYSSAGYFYRDNSVYNLGTSSLRCEPKSSSTAATMEWQIIAPTGEPVTVTGYLRKNSSYGSSNLPTVTLSGLGITASTYTMTDVNDTWDQFIVSGTQTTGTDGILQLSISFQSGTAGAKVYVSGIAAPPYSATNTGEFGYWYGGKPQQLIMATPLSAIDVWNTLVSSVTVSGSMGVFIKRLKGVLRIE